MRALHGIWTSTSQLIVWAEDGDRQPSPAAVRPPRLTLWLPSRVGAPLPSPELERPGGETRVRLLPWAMPASITSAGALHCRNAHRRAIRLLRTGAVRAEPLSEEVALRIGLLLAATGTSDVIDAQVVLLARRLDALVVTSDPDDLARLDRGLDLVTV